MREYTKHKLQVIAEETITVDKEYAVKTTKDVHAFVREVCEIHLCPEENCIEIVINAKGQIIGWKTVSIGDLCSSIIHPREVFKYAICANAFALILAHNHPSGDPTPSGEDIRVTKRLVEAGNILGIEILDHIIIGEEAYVSMKAMGELDEV